MAVESSGNSSNNKRRKRSAMAFGRGRFYGLKQVFRAVMGVFAALIILACLFGYINQVQTGQSIFDWIMETSGELSETLDLIFTGDQDAPIQVTDQGVYVDGHQPDGAENILGNGTESEVNEE